MDKKLTDSETVKALECCMDEMGCKKGCPCFDPKSKSSHCTAIGDNGLEKLALDLINRLQAENEELLDTRWSTNQVEKLQNTTRIEAYKECIEKVKEIMHKYCGDITEDDLNNLLKELVGEDK